MESDQLTMKTSAAQRLSKKANHKNFISAGWLSVKSDVNGFQTFLMHL